MTAATQQGGLCLVCLTYFGHSEGCCSVCLSYIKSLHRSWSSIIGEYSPEELSAAVLQQVPTWRERQAAEQFAQTFVTLDEASHQLAMQPQMFGHFKRNLKTSEVSPESLARQMFTFGRPLITAAQAKELLETLRGRNETDYKYYHVVCSRVVDPWNLNANDHGLGHCYYGYLDTFDADTQRSLAKLIGRSDCETLAAVFWRLICQRVRFDSAGLPQWSDGNVGACAAENFLHEDDLKFIRDEMIVQGVAETADVLVTCCHVGDTVSCTTMPGP
eukprot:TRINITY_DN19793_c0_g1_i3.p1 TRINITY_DN19793_c0_g1~~TRINITY_DN19793_c0_g1_i3.p1  ORF type:complete len:274 (-),score=39.62 TRINITY_DN19793_c0_g1_i3:43-864(-)